MHRQPYEVKFKNYIKMLTEAKESGIQVIVIHHPQVLGDTYAELIESLNRLAAAELFLSIVPPAQRGKPDIMKP